MCGGCEDDVHQRKIFAPTYRQKPASFWATAIHMTIDVKLFKVYLNGDHVPSN